MLSNELALFVAKVAKDLLLLLLFCCAQCGEKMMEVDSCIFWYCICMKPNFLFGSLAMFVMYVKIHSWVGNEFACLPDWKSTFECGRKLQISGGLHGVFSYYSMLKASSLVSVAGCSTTSFCDRILNSYSAFRTHPEQLVSIVSTSDISIRLIIIPKGDTVDQRQGCTV